MEKNEIKLDIGLTKEEHKEILQAIPSNNEPTRYCVCKSKDTKGAFMISCDGCEDWFHGSCVHLDEGINNNLIGIFLFNFSFRNC
jgi:hypothetical protein